MELTIGWLPTPTPMNRRNIFKLALCAVAASAMEVFGMKEAIAVVPEPKMGMWTASMIQRMLPAGQPLDEPPEASDPSLEKVWEKITSHPDGSTLHQRLYAPVGVLPNGLTDEQALGSFSFIYSREISQRSKGTVVWKDIAP